MGKGKGKNYVPDKVTDGLDNIKDEIDGWIPDLDIKKQLGDLYDSVQELWEKGYENIDVKGNYIDPWTDKVIDYADVNLVVPRSGKVMTKGSKKNDLMSGHWEKHKYEGGNGNDRIFTWYGKDTLIGGNGKDHLYADGDDCTMVGGNGKDYFYLDGDATVMIKDYRKNGKDIIRVDGYSKNKIKINNKNGNSLIKAGKKTLAKVMGVKNLNKNQLEYHGGNTKTKSIDHDHDHHGHADHRKADISESEVITQMFSPVADL